MPYAKDEGDDGTVDVAGLDADQRGESTMSCEFASSTDLDRDLERRVVSFLLQCGVLRTSGIIVRVQDGMVTLRGKVRSFYERQLCVHSGRRVAGVRKLVDELEVVG
ncbi:MAG: BON domain-containing protein [Planctomycetes bacterium]|nr:BON domain-containing protein [Planctomycetota bacterium]